MSWLIQAETEVAERQMLIRQNFEEMWKAYNNPALILGNFHSMMGSPAFGKAAMESIDQSYKGKIEEALALVRQLRMKMQSEKELISTGG